MASKNENQFGLIILGNSGVGKSFVANILLDKEVFKHEFSARSVTHRTEFEEITFHDHRYAIFNIPGLIEADQTRVDLNKREIDHAFTQRPSSLIIYIFGQQNGRIRDEDVVAFNAINSAYPLKIESLLLVVNGLPANRPENYEGEVMLMLQDIIQVQVSADRVCFLNHIDQESKREREGLRNELLRCIVELSPSEHLKAHDIHLRVDDVATLKKQIEDMTKTFQENKIYFQNEILEQQKRYDTLIADQKSEADHYRRIIERQVDESGQMREAQTEQFQAVQQAHQSQLAAMQDQMENMQTNHQQLLREMSTQNKQQAELSREALNASQKAQENLRKKMEELITPPKPKSSSCFVAGTLVHMADGTDKVIEKIQIGDVVLGGDNQPRSVMYLDVEQLGQRYLYGINNSSPFFTSEHVFITSNGMMVAMDPQASESEEPSLRGLVKPLVRNLELQSLIQNRPSMTTANELTCIKSDPSMMVYNVVLESGHTYYANGFCVFDMFPNLAQCPQMFKLLHLLWRNSALQIDAHFDDITTPGSADRLRLEKLAEHIQEAISLFLSQNC